MGQKVAKNKKTEQLYTTPGNRSQVEDEVKPSQSSGTYYAILIDSHGASSPSEKNSLEGNIAKADFGPLCLPSSRYDLHVENGSPLFETEWNRLMWG